MLTCAVPGCPEEGIYMVSYEEQINICQEPYAFFAVCEGHSEFERKDDQYRVLMVPLR